jgi:hypothetical protein
VHMLAPVPVAFRAYYKVEVPEQGPALDIPAPAEPVLEAVPAAAEPVVGEPVMAEPVMAEPVMAEPVMAEAQFAEASAAAEQPSNGKRSLGFFAH